MNLKEYIETNRINKNTFLVIHNKEDKWIIAGLSDDPRLRDYMTLNVINTERRSDLILVVQTDYEQDMQIAYYQMKAELAERVKANPDSRHTKIASIKKKKK